MPTVLIAADELVAARYQMALSLGFHIVLSCFGVALPAMIYVLHRRGVRNGDQEALALAKKWAKASAVLFAIGAVSGTILSFEMGLLWPGMMSTFGDVIGLPFAMEGIAFFLEAIFLGIYLYGWGRLRPEVHLRTLIPIMLSGLFGTFCILAVNAWMNAPAGFTMLADGTVTDVDPLAAIFNDALWPQFLHMWVATFVVAGFLTSAVYAVGMLRGRRDRSHRLGFTVPFVFAAVAALAQPAIGHWAGTRLDTQQPSKLAAMELALETEDRAPVVIGGVLIDGEVRGGIEIPAIASLLAGNSFDTVIVGLEDIPEDERPPVNIVHWSFQTMIAAGTAMIALGGWYGWRRRRYGADGVFESTWFLRAAVAAGPVAVIALQAGWVTTEVGRQPWIVYGVMRVEDAVTSNSGIWISLAAMVVIYTSMAVVGARVLLGMARRWRADPSSDLPTPYGPGGSLHDVDTTGPPTDDLVGRPS
ncbi:MAG: cytochrome ubiquinol oxidase subunit I [Ilumatobacter sp.]|uniref:cytochrome ubiquinol oxidase subunit I n=1 Tax=Ilumatobacter sp. TaxID=1967498 RepID=UPI002633E925|nr:cytochrome ubiquinol oxidase subunit I [Ilumatobacter sp.]MDJ0768416.1 cytochrome ubiquinol oxidase subunit I [Ilumatobacter sp.]